MLAKPKRIISDKMVHQFVNDEYRYFFQLCVLCLLLGSVSFFMGVLNIITQKIPLMIATLSFAAISYFNFLLLLRKKKAKSVNFAIFEVSISALFIYFLITGGTAGFSPHWILILPACGMMLLGKKRGMIVSAIVFVMIGFLLWLPFGKSLLIYKDYSPEFCMRFPIVYLAFFAVGYCFEWIRKATADVLFETQKKLALAADTDALTGLNNRRCFNRELDRLYGSKVHPYDGLFLIADIDNFKSVNDTFGHSAGDAALIAVADKLRSQLRETDLLCRWGGEEFFAFLPQCDVCSMEQICQRLCHSVTEIVIPEYPDLHLSISIGVVPVHMGETIRLDFVFVEADNALYRAKSNGKNRVEFSEANP